MSKIDLLSIPTKAPEGFTKKECRKKLKEYAKEIGELQNLMYAEGKHSLLVVLQGMDASGKGGATRKVFRGVNPLGIKVHSFKGPTKEELSHDFLWRVHKQVPAKGMIQIFDRSHYEDVLITRVEGWIDDETAKERFHLINYFERLLKHNNTTVLKFYLHVSEEEQKARFYERIALPEKQWKYGPEDLEKAKQWPAYRKVYEDVFEHGSEIFPWMIVPTDDNWYKEYFVAKTVLETMRGFNMQYPKGDIDFESADVKAILQEFQEA